jgi:catalase
VFFIRDPAKFPRFIHTQKTDPATNVRDWNTFWAWPAQFPESILQFLRLLSDLGTPYGFRHMHGWSGHTYKLVQNDGSFVYTRVKLESEQGVRNFTDAEAKKQASENDAWATKDLFDAIKEGNYPAWKVSIATMTEEEAANYRYDILDLTKDWLNVTYHDIGRMVLTQNPENYHAEIEQAHFSPSNMVEGWVITMLRATASAPTTHKSPSTALSALSPTSTATATWQSAETKALGKTFLTNTATS